MGKYALKQENITQHFSCGQMGHDKEIQAFRGRLGFNGTSHMPFN